MFGFMTNEMSPEGELSEFACLVPADYFSDRRMPDPKASSTLGH